MRNLSPYQTFLAATCIVCATVSAAFGVIDGNTLGYLYLSVTGYALGYVNGKKSGSAE